MLNATAQTLFPERMSYKVSTLLDIKWLTHKGVIWELTIDNIIVISHTVVAWSLLSSCWIVWSCFSRVCYEDSGGNRAGSSSSESNSTFSSFTHFPLRSCSHPELE